MLRITFQFSVFALKINRQLAKGENDIIREKNEYSLNEFKEQLTRINWL
jgi:hypothetical protein